MSLTTSFFGGGPQGDRRLGSPSIFAPGLPVEIMLLVGGPHDGRGLVLATVAVLDVLRSPVLEALRPVDELSPPHPTSSDDAPSNANSPFSL